MPSLDDGLSIGGQLPAARRSGERHRGTDARRARGEQHQVLLGVTGSGKTFTMAKVIEAVGRPALVLAHNKTLAAQLYQEFKSFFPDNAVEYFVSYYDYYQPEAYIPVERRLHRKGSHHQRRAGQAAPLRHPVAVRAARLRHRRQRELHLRPRLARSVLRHAADARKGPEDLAQADHSPSWWRFSTTATRAISGAARFACAAT